MHTVTISFALVAGKLVVPSVNLSTFSLGREYTRIDLYEICYYYRTALDCNSLLGSTDKKQSTDFAVIVGP